MTLHRYEGTIHGFWRWQAKAALARRAVRERRRFVTRSSRHSRSGVRAARALDDSSALVALP